MDILDRLLGHDEWTTRQVLQRCHELTLAQLEQRFDIGQVTIAQTWLHVIGNIEVWTDLMRERPPRTGMAPPTPVTIAALSTRFDAAYADFAAFARQIASTDRLDAEYLDVLDDPPTTKTFGGSIAHVLTHDMQHRGEILQMLERLGLRDLPEGDMLSWEWHNSQK